MNFGEPWAWEPDGEIFVRADGFCAFDFPSNPKTSPATRRILECVNALAGLDPAGLDDVLEALELIAAWRLPTPDFETEFGSNGAREHMRGLAVAALAAIGRRKEEHA